MVNNAHLDPVTQRDETTRRDASTRRGASTRLDATRRDAVTDRLRSAGCVFAEDEARLLTECADSPTRLDRLVGARCRGDPLEYVLGWAEFLGRRLAVEKPVFVPRRRTEFLARNAIAQARAVRGRTPVVVDMCCGAGAVAAAVAQAVSPVAIVAADLHPTAVACARKNIGDDGVVVAGDLFRALPARLRGRIDVLTANTPYVPTAEVATMPREARDHEARIALDGGPDGLDVQRRLIVEAGDWLATGGRALVETSARQAPATSAIFDAAGLVPQTLHSSGADATIVAGREPARGDVLDRRA